jgi:hypothetical protein
MYALSRLGLVSGKGCDYLMLDVADGGANMASAKNRLPWNDSLPGRQRRAGCFAKASARSVPIGANVKRISERHA